MHPKMHSTCLFNLFRKHLYSNVKKKQNKLGNFCLCSALGSSIHTSLHQSNSCNKSKWNMNWFYFREVRRWKCSLGTAAISSHFINTTWNGPVLLSKDILIIQNIWAETQHGQVTCLPAKKSLCPTHLKKGSALKDFVYLQKSQK